MSNLSIQTFLTEEITDSLWSSYLKNFNSVFQKSFDLKHFKNKYNSCLNNSYHSFLINNSDDVVAATSIIPMDYKIDKKKIIVGLVVDLFVKKEFRKDPLIILKLYSDLKKTIKNEISIVLAVPNVNSVGYFLNILKFKKIGYLKYWILPLNIGNVNFRRNNMLNKVSHFYSSIHILFNKIISTFFKFNINSFRVSLNLNEDFLSKRFLGPYKNYNINNYKFNYRIVSENGVNTAYLIYFANKNKPDFKSFLMAVNFIKKNESIDLILYVGSLTFYQTLLFKVPKYLEPKNLPFIYENINLNSSQLEIINNFKNWNFSLIHYDVR